MNNFIIPLLLILLLFFHRIVRRFTATGKVKEAFCALWLVDTIFAACGTVLSFVIYRYSLTGLPGWQSLIFITLYLLVTVVFLLITPSGLQVFCKAKSKTPEEQLRAEYRFNETLGLVRDFFLLLLIILPLALGLFSLRPQLLSAMLPWSSTEICSATCFVIFLILLPLCLRQSLFWLKNLQNSPTEAEIKLLQNYRTQIYFRRKNHRL